MRTKRDNKEGDGLLQRAINGDQRALADLVGRHSAMAYTIAVRITLNKEDAEEVVQDAFIKAFSSLERFKRSARFSTWLYRIVHNTALDKVRGRRTDDGRGGALSQARTPVQGNAGWEDLVDGDRIAYLDRAMELLCETDRSLFALYYSGGRPISEISKVTGLKRSAIKMRLARGRNKIKEELERLLGNEKDSLL